MIAPSAAPPPTFAASSLCVGSARRVKPSLCTPTVWPSERCSRTISTSQRRNAAHPAAAIARYHPAFHPRATLGDDKAIHDKLLVQRACERIAWQIPLRGEPVDKAHWDQCPSVQRNPVGLRRSGWRRRSHVLRFGSRGWNWLRRRRGFRGPRRHNNGVGRRLTARQRHRLYRPGLRQHWWGMLRACRLTAFTGLNGEGCERLGGLDRDGLAARSLPAVAPVWLRTGAVAAALVSARPPAPPDVEKSS